MLKIKDDVDLKELEKFGFKKFEILEDYYRYLDDNEKSCLIIYCDDRHIEIETLNNIFRGKEIINEVPDKLYDLVQADLVEKVGGEDE